MTRKMTLIELRIYADNEVTNSSEALAIILSFLRACPEPENFVRFQLVDHNGIPLENN